VSALPAPDKDIRPAPPSLCEPYTVLPAACCEPGCGKPATEEHHAVPKWRSRGWKERDWAYLYGILTQIKFPACLESHKKLTDNEARLWCDEFGPEWRWQVSIGEGNYEDIEYIEVPSVGQAGTLLGCSEVQALPALSDSDVEATDDAKAAEYMFEKHGVPVVTEAALSEGDRDFRPEGPPSGAFFSAGVSSPSESAALSEGDPHPSPSESAEDHDCEAVCTCGEKLTRRRRKKSEQVNNKRRRTFSVWIPADIEDGAETLDGLVDALREVIGPQLGYDEKTPDYYLLVAGLYAYLQEAKAA
jgi:hypothetical protein